MTYYLLGSIYPVKKILYLVFQKGELFEPKQKSFGDHLVSFWSRGLDAIVLLAVFIIQSHFLFYLFL